MEDFRRGPHNFKIQEVRRNKLATVRKERGLTQAELAEKIGRSKKVISGWECGARKPSFVSLQRLAKALDIDVFELVDDDE